LSAEYTLYVVVGCDTV